MAMETHPTKQNFDLAFRGIPPEIRTMIWHQCIAVAGRICQEVPYWEFSTLKGLEGSRYIQLEYDLSDSRNLCITNILIHDLGIIFADKKTHAEVVHMVREQTCAVFRPLDDLSFSWLRLLSHVTRQVRRVILQFGRECLQRTGENKSCLQRVLRYLDSYQPGLRLFVRFEEVAVKLLVERDPGLQRFVALLDCPRFQVAVEHVRENKAVEVWPWERNWTVECVKKSEGS